MVIMNKHRRCLAAFVMVNTIGNSMVLMVSDMMRLVLATFVKAIWLHGSPNGLERRQHQQEIGEQSTHGRQYIGSKSKVDPIMGEAMLRNRPRPNLAWPTEPPCPISALK